MSFEHIDKLRQLVVRLRLVEPSQFDECITRLGPTNDDPDAEDIVSLVVDVETTNDRTRKARQEETWQIVEEMILRYDEKSSWIMRFDAGLVKPLRRQAAP